MDGSIFSATLALEAGPLRNALRLIKPAIPTRFAIPPKLVITNHHGQTALTGIDSGDLEITIALPEPYQPFSPGLPHRELSALLRPCAPGDAVTIRPETDHSVKIDLPDLTATITSNKGDVETRLKEQREPGETARIDAKPLAKALELVSGAMSNEETRYYLNGVFIQPDATDPTALNFVATDGHRLVAHTVTGMSHTLTTGIIVPRGAIHALRPILAAYPEATLNLTRYGETVLDITCPGFELNTKLIDGTYPDYQRVIPNDVTPAASMDAAAMRRFLLRVGGLAPHRCSCIKITLRKNANKAELSWQSHEIGTITTIIDAHCERDLEIGFQGRYLGHMLNILKALQITMYASDGAGPTTFTGAAELAEPLTTIVVMSMRV